ncbi:hypothetical protein AQJ11_08860 [Streptomyces corchorusii]|uniref:Uncharacterized protein n=1 Tax=Streptomyces corchorusii TaxID=1903 RepID=A0A101QJS1_STRCK|nr:hypothetical protein AQJ11_08860 [Streptomyces corchorusii]
MHLPANRCPPTTDVPFPANRRSPDGRRTAPANRSAHGRRGRDPVAFVRSARPARPPSAHTPEAWALPPVLAAPRPAGRFKPIEVNCGGPRAVPVYTAEGLPVRLVRR